MMARVAGRVSHQRGTTTISRLGYGTFIQDKERRAQINAGDHFVFAKTFLHDVLADSESYSAVYSNMTFENLTAGSWTSWTNKNVHLITLRAADYLVVA